MERLNGIVINMDPVIFRIGSFELRWYSLAIILAVIAAVLIAAYRCKKKGIDADEFYSLVPWILIGGVVGARLFHVFDNFSYYAANPFQILLFQQGGLAIWGGLAGGGIAVIVYAWQRHMPMGRLFDVLAPALLVAQIIGRIGCIINGDAYGGVTDLPWAFIYIHPDSLIPQNLVGLPTHPYPVYEMAWNLINLLIILRLGRYFKNDGLLFLSYLSLYSVERFVLTFVRQESALIWGLQQAQVIAIAILIVSLALLIYLSRKARHATTPTS